MSGSSRRIVLVGVLLAAAAAVVGLALAELMVDEHAVWLERSFRNRWAFRDVPARRGAIRDRSGTPLVVDEPQFALEVDYAGFRRHHPVGMTVNAAALALPEGCRYADGPDAVLASLQRVLALPVAVLGSEVSGRERARDLRFYVFGLGAFLAQSSRAAVARRLLPAIAAGERTPIRTALGLDPVRSAAAIAASASALDALSARLRAASPAADLPRTLDALHARHARGDDGPLLRTVAASLPYEAVAEVALEAEAWPGFLPRPTVRRVVAGEARLRWPSLAGLVGEVTAFGWAEDEARLDHAAQALLEEAELASYLPESDGLDEEAGARLEERAAAFVRRRLEAGGRVGRSGVERAADDELAGRPGLRWVERDARAREQLLYRSLEVAPGRDVHLTVDVRLQEILELCLDEHARGLDTAMVVVDARSGDVLAIGGRPLELPGPDGPVPRRVSPAATWRNAGFLGSLAKPFVLLEQLAAARAGAPHADLGRLQPCAMRWKRIAGTQRYLACDGVHGAGGQEPVRALADSCNVFFFQLAEALGQPGLQRAYARAGWCEPEDPGVPSAVQASVPGVAGLSAGGLESAHHALELRGIGYGLKASALLVARAYAGLATGSLPTLGLVRELPRAPPVPLGVPADDLALVQAGLRRCVTDGTAAGVSGLAELGVHGKTGTAEVTDAGLNNAWFAGFVMAAPGRPTLAFAAVAYSVEDHGRESAAMVRDFLRGVFEHPDAALRRHWLEGSEER